MLPACDNGCYLPSATQPSNQFGHPAAASDGTNRSSNLTQDINRLLNAIMRTEVTPEDLAALLPEVERQQAGVNGRTRRGPLGTSSRYRGVTRHRRTRRWEAHIWDNKKQVYLGGFNDEDHAAKAHDVMALKCRGAATGVNFKLELYDQLLPLILRLTREDVVRMLRRQSKNLSNSAPPPASKKVAKVKAAARPSGLMQDVDLPMTRNPSFLSTSTLSGGTQLDGECFHQMFRDLSSASLVSGQLSDEDFKDHLRGVAKAATPGDTSGSDDEMMQEMPPPAAGQKLPPIIDLTTCPTSPRPRPGAQTSGAGQQRPPSPAALMQYNWVHPLGGQMMPMPSGAWSQQPVVLNSYTIVAPPDVFASHGSAAVRTPGYPESPMMAGSFSYPAGFALQSSAMQHQTAQPVDMATMPQGQAMQASYPATAVARTNTAGQTTTMHPYQIRVVGAAQGAGVAVHGFAVIPNQKVATGFPVTPAASSPTYPTFSARGPPRTSTMPALSPSVGPSSSHAHSNPTTYRMVSAPMAPTTSSMAPSSSHPHSLPTAYPMFSNPMAPTTSTMGPSASYANPNALSSPMFSDPLETAFTTMLTCPPTTGATSMEMFSYGSRPMMMGSSAPSTMLPSLGSLQALMDAPTAGPGESDMLDEFLLEGSGLSGFMSFEPAPGMAGFNTDLF